MNYKTRFIDLASEINSSMPIFVVKKVIHALNADRKPLNGSRVLVLGVAYNRDIDDVRESPALDVIRLLEEGAAEVTFHDPYIDSVRGDGHTRHGVELCAEVLAESDAVVRDGPPGG